MVECFRIRFFGDFTTGENYQLRYDGEYRINILRQNGYDYLFKDIKEFFEDSYNVVNLETPITNCVSSGLSHKKTVLHWSDPLIVPNLLKKYNINAVSLGNNHGYDYGDIGLRQTLGCLKEANISCFGAGLSIADAKVPHFVNFSTDNKVVNFYIFGGYKYRQDYDEEFNFYAKDNKSGVFLLTPETIKEQIEKIKNEDKNSCVIIFQHFGFDNQKRVSHQIQYARQYIDYGADFVIGHGPHRLNNIEYYKDKLIIYSIGNFIFPANFKNSGSPYNAISELEVMFENGEVVFNPKLYPIYIDNASFVPVTRPIYDNEIDEFLKLLLEYNMENVRERISVEKEGKYICIKL